MHSTRMSLSEWFATFRAEEVGTRQSTRRMRALAMEICLATVGDMNVRDFDAQAARRLQRGIVESPTRNTVSTNSYLRMLNPVFERAVCDGLLEENPLKFLRKLREPRSKVEVYSPAEVAALLAACRRLQRPGSRRVWRLRILLAACAGLRRGEVLNLQVGDVDFDGPQIWIAAKRQTERSWAWSVKDHEDRKVPLPKVLADALAEAVAELPAGQPYVALSPQRYRGCLRLLSAGRWTEPLSNLPDANFRQPFMRLCRAAGVEHRTFHALRATAITMWLQKGVPVHEVKLLAGHADVETTMRYYAAVRSDHCQRAASAIDGIKELSIGATGLEAATS